MSDDWPRGAGWPGLIIAGLCFTAPATAITLAFAWSYVRFGSTPELSWVLYGVKPVVIGVMVHAILSLSRPMMSRPLLLGGCVLARYFLGVNEIALLFGVGLAVVVGAGLGRFRAERSVAAFALPGLPWLAGSGAGHHEDTPRPRRKILASRSRPLVNGGGPEPFTL